MLKRTPLFAAHQKLGGKLIEFGGWEMPVQYTRIMDEHQAVRTAAGLFDISHMGEVFVRGTGASDFLNRTLTNDLQKLADGQGQYALMCNERGGVIDDLYVYRLAPTEFLLIVNASRIEADVAWLNARLRLHWASHPGSDVTVNDFSDEMGAIAIQGPHVVRFIDQLFPGPPQRGTWVARPAELKKNQLGVWQVGESDGGALEASVARTGYTGEDGFEVVVDDVALEELWNNALELGSSAGLKPCGLGARDTLRTEMGYPLYGHELNEATTPIEAGLGFFVALHKGEFVGRAVLVEQKEKGVSKKCVAFKMTDKSAPPRPNYLIWSSGPATTPIGEVVSGTQSPSLGIGIGLGYVPPQFAKPGTNLEIEIRGRCFPAVVVQKPIYRKPAGG